MRTKNLAAMSVMALTIAVSALVACGGEPPPPPAPPPPPPPPATASATPAPTDTTPPAPPPKPALADLIPQTLKGMGDAFNAHDANKMAGFFTDDALVSAYGEPDSHSRNDLASAMTTFFTAFPDAKSAALRVWVKGNIAISEMAWTGTMSGDMGPMKATNKPVGAQRLHVLFFTDDGLVKEMHEYGDASVIVAQASGKKGAAPIPTLPTNPPEVHVSKGTPDEDKLADWAKSQDDVFSKDDVKGVLATIADDGDYWINLGGGPATKGKKDNEKALKVWFKAFPDQKWSVTNAWGIDGFAIVEHTVSGTHKGAMGPLPASGKPVQNWHWIDIMQPTADGKLQHGWGYANMFEMLAQTGQLKGMSGDTGKAGAGAKAPPPAPKKP